MRITLPLLSLMLACPRALADPGCTPSQEAVLAALNALRSQVQQCGARELPPARPLRWQPQLASAALQQAQYLAAIDQISHLGEAGESLGQRLRRAGYPLRRAGENLAAGVDTLYEVLGRWKDSAAHCENLMAGEFEDVGLACVRGPGAFGVYWVLDLGKPATAEDRPLRSSPGQSP